MCIYLLFVFVRDFHKKVVRVAVQRNEDSTSIGARGQSGDGTPSQEEDPHAKIRYVF